MTDRVDSLGQTVREALDGGVPLFYPEDRKARRDAAKAAIAELSALARERGLLTCPYCAHSFVPQEGRTYESCPGCKRAQLAEAERDRLAAQVVCAQVDTRGKP